MSTLFPGILNLCYWLNVKVQVHTHTKLRVKFVFCVM